MQLFITDFMLSWNDIVIFEPRIVNQLSKVLRAKVGYLFELQRNIDQIPIRYKLKLISINKKEVHAEIVEKRSPERFLRKVWFYVPILNKFDKMELIVQKLSEIWVYEIVFYKASRSIVKVISDNKLDRLIKISIEAVEQSKWWKLPVIRLVNDFIKDIKRKNVVVFDMDWKDNLRKDTDDIIYGIVWPEWWFDQVDLDIISWNKIATLWLWENVLRTESATIIWAWLLKFWLIIS